MPRTIRYGNTGKTVKYLQELLNKHFSDQTQLEPDSKFGKDTRAAVEYYQSIPKHGLAPPDGVVGPKTWKALEGILATEAKSTNRFGIPEWEKPREPQPSLKITEVKLWTDMTEITIAKWLKFGFTVANLTRGTLVSFGVVSLASKAAWAAASGTFIFGAIIGVGVSLGLPVAEAKAKVRKRNIANGLINGTVLVVLEYGRPTLKKYLRRPSGGFQPKYMYGVASRHYNIGLLAGYQAAIQLSEKERKEIRDQLTKILISEAKEGKYKLYMTTWSYSDWIGYYSQALAK